MIVWQFSEMVNLLILYPSDFQRDTMCQKICPPWQTMLPSMWEVGHPGIPSLELAPFALCHHVPKQSDLTWHICLLAQE